MILNGEYGLITSDESFCCPDGLFYRAIYGRCWIHPVDESIGIQRRGHVNWMVRVCHDEDNETGVCLGGCRCNYFVKMDKPPQILLSNMVMMYGTDRMPFPFYYPNVYQP